MNIVAMFDEEKISERIKFHPIKTLSGSVKKFYNGPCAEIIIISDAKHIDEIIKLLLEIQR